MDVRGTLTGFEIDPKDEPVTEATDQHQIKEESGSYR